MAKKKKQSTGEAIVMYVVPLVFFTLFAAYAGAVSGHP